MWQSAQPKAIWRMEWSLAKVRLGEGEKAVYHGFGGDHGDHEEVVPLQRVSGLSCWVGWRGGSWFLLRLT